MVVELEVVVEVAVEVVVEVSWTSVLCVSGGSTRCGASWWWR